jgi:hypothetical protein
METIFNSYKEVNTMLRLGRLLMILPFIILGGCLIAISLFRADSHAAAQGVCVQPPSGMINWWPGDGHANDIQGANHGMLQNGTTFTAGKVEQAFSFDGVDDYMSLASIPAWNFGIGDFTVDFWARSSNSSRRMHALSFEPNYGASNLDFDFNDPDRPSFSEQPVGLWVYWNSSGNNRITAGSPGDYTDGQWRHFALTRSGTTFTLYVNGSIAGTATYSEPIDLSNSALNWIGAGGAGGGPALPWDGSIDEVGIFNRALTASEIQAIVNAGSAGKCKFTAVEIDIKPGSFPNSINLGSRGAVPVAIISTAAFDARTVDPTTVTLAGAQVRLRGRGTPMASIEDVNGDGLLDLVVHVSTEALQLSESDTEAILEGQTFGGTRIRGADSVRIVP